MKAMMLKKRGLPLFFVMLMTAVSLLGVDTISTPLAQAKQARPTESNGVALTPYMGWSTWDYLESPTAASVEAQARVEASKLKASGYNYIMVDEGWYLNPSTTVDQYGHWVANPSRFPNGLAAVATYVHSLGLKFGAYLTPGIPVAAVNQNTPIQGTTYHARDIANTGAHEPNYGYGNSVMYAINNNKPGAQAYFNSWANQLASWGVDLLKLDGVGDHDIADIQQWSSALKQSGRGIVFDLSNQLDVNNGSVWRQYANAWRIGKDDECYCKTQTNWAHVVRVLGEPAPWTKFAGPGGWNDLDSLQISNGPLDGISNDERQTMMSFWSIEASPLYLGDDLTRLDSFGLSLLTNSEVIAIDQAGRPANPVSLATNQQVWFVKNSNGSYTVGLFNIGATSASVRVNWSSLGFSGSPSVHDVWSHSNLGRFSGSFSATLNAHASRLLTVTP